MDLSLFLEQDLSAESPKLKRSLIDYASSGTCCMKDAQAIFASLSPNFKIELSSLKSFLCFCFENEPMETEALHSTMLPMLRQNFLHQVDFTCVVQIFKSFQKFNHSREFPRSDFSCFVDYLEQLPAFQLCLQKDHNIRNALFLALVCNSDFARTNFLVQTTKLNSVSVEVFLSKFGTKVTVEMALTLFSHLDIEAKIRVIRCCSCSPTVSQAMINSISPMESSNRSAHLEESLIKTLQKITVRRDAKSAVDFLNKVAIDSDDGSREIIIVSQQCLAHLQHMTLACVSKNGDIYLAGINLTVACISV
jgi:hypothetical protein